MSDDDEQKLNSGEETEPAPAGESNSEVEPPPAGEEPEPEPAATSDSTDEHGDTNLEPPDAVSDSSAESDGSSLSSSSSPSSESSSSSSDNDRGSSSSDGSSQGQISQPPPSEDAVAQAVASALQMREVPVDSDGVKVTLSSGLYQVMVRLADNFMPLPQVPADTSNLAPGSVRGAKYLLQGAVQIIEDQTRVTLRIVSLETSAILEAGEGNASGGTGVDGVQPATEDAIANLPSLGAR